jgi:1-aminocyclopropane-1-carboxylate deaminase/D-cysteine desulfhydrase-like pyridoxal-dependent ACC family enzyme
VTPPRHPLIDGPSPFHRLPRFSQELGGRVDIWAKREDLIPLAFGGNKLRNLEYLIGAALAEGADSLVTSGRRWSNHCRLTAAAGVRAGLEVHLVLSGPPIEPPGPGQRLMELYGATVHVTPTADRDERELRVRTIADELLVSGRHPYVIGVGGSGPIGAYGQVMAAREAEDQWRADGLEPAAIIVPSATGGTQAGLLVGLRSVGSTAMVVGVAVARPVDELRSAIATTMTGLAELTGAVVEPVEIVIDGDHRGPGYGVPTEAAAEATALLARTEAILVDPIYTAKGLAGLVARVRAGNWDGRAVVFWHAGGTPGIFEPLDLT